MNVLRETLSTELLERIRSKEDAPKLVSTLKEMYEEFHEQQLMILSCDHFKKPCTLQINTMHQGVPKTREIKCNLKSCDRCLISR